MPHLASDTSKSAHCCTIAVSWFPKRESGETEINVTSFEHSHFHSSVSLSGTFSEQTNLADMDCGHIYR